MLPSDLSSLGLMKNIPPGYTPCKVFRGWTDVQWKGFFCWDEKKTSKKLQLSNENMTCKVKDGSGFKTTCGNFVSPQYYSLLIFSRFFYQEVSIISKSLFLRDLSSKSA